MAQESKNIRGKIAIVYFLILFFAVLILFFVIQFIWGETVGRMREQRLKQAMKPFTTYTGLIGVAKGCDEYKEQYGEWPTNFAQILPLKPEMKDWIKDEWGRDAMLVPYKNSLGYGEVISYGQDGKPGGNGADQDIILRFPVEANAVWDEQVGEGLEKPDRMQPWTNWFYEGYDIKRPSDQ